MVSDGTVGLVVRDKNGLSDNVDIGSGTANGQAVWVVANNNGGDVFKFEFGINCSQHPTNGAIALCKRLGSTKANLDMVGGSDRVDMTGWGRPRLGQPGGGQRRLQREQQLRQRVRQHGRRHREHLRRQ